MIKNKKTSRTKTELLVVILTLISIWTLAFFNFRISQVKARDIQRKNDLKHIRAALDDYAKDNKVYPLSKNGKILACGVDTDLAICEWGEGIIHKRNPTPQEPYISPLPRDPQNTTAGRTYVYESNSKSFKLYTSLEQKNETEYNEELVKLNKYCGAQVCSFGITSAEDVNLLENY